MTVRFHVTFIACLVLALGGTSPLRAQVDLYIAHVADGGGYFTQVSVHNPGGNNAANCTFSTFDDQGNPLDLVYDATAADATASVHRRSGAIPADATPASSLKFSVIPFATFTTETNGAGGANGAILQGGAELSCDNTVIGGATYWLTTSAGEIVTGIGVPATASSTTFFRAIGGNYNTAFAIFNSTNSTNFVTIEAFDDTGANSYGPTSVGIDANGHYAFNANASDVNLGLPSDFSGSFRLNSGQGFVAIALGVQSTTTNEAGYVLFTIPTQSGPISGIDAEAKTVR